jgi:ubiquinone/menaquinone biosynthesis C-methylase UbiE/uncharacterized protein YbaR (Trm112 family)
LRPELVKWLRCPSCHAHNLDLTVFESIGEGSVVTNGVLICETCRTPYKIEDRIAEMIVRDPPWITVKEDFTTRFGEELAELPPSSAEIDPAKAVDEHKKGQAEVFDQIVKIYEGMTDSHFWKAVDKHVDGLWGADLRQHPMVLEVGCGNGRISRPLATGRTVVVGVDISRGMLSKAIAEAEAQGNDNLFYVMGDVENLPFQEQIFDACVIYGVLHHLASPSECLKEVSRVLQSKGQIYALENNRSMFRGLFDLLVKMRKLWEEHPSDHYVMSPEEVKAWGRDAGLDINTQTMIYLPPHLVNPLGASGAERAIGWSERILGSLPILRRHGGLLYIRGTKVR